MARAQLPRIDGVDGYTRTLLSVDQQMRYGGGVPISRASSVGEMDLVVRHHEFIRSGKEAHERDAIQAKKYWDQLHKEYALADLSRWRERKVGLRWRTETEVLSGKGQFQCAALDCDGVIALHSFELPFRYLEHSIQKEALVKVRVCGTCAPKLFGGDARSVSRDNSGESTAGLSRAGAESVVPRTHRRNSRSRSPRRDERHGKESSSRRSGRDRDGPPTTLTTRADDVSQRPLTRSGT